MVSDTDRILCEFLGEYFKSIANEGDDMTLLEATDGGLHTLLKRHFERETQHTEFLKSISDLAEGEARARITTALYDQCTYLERLASLPGVFDEFFTEKTSGSMAYSRRLSKEVESAKRVEQETREYLDSQN